MTPLDSGIVVAILGVCGSALVAVIGIAVAKILGTNAEEMRRLQGVEDRSFVLEDYCHDLRDWGDSVRTAAINFGMAPSSVPKVPDWPDALKTRPGR